MKREFIRFDIDNPDSFNVLHSWHLKELSDEDKEQYEIEAQKYYDFRREEKRIMETKPRNWEEVESRWRNKEQVENALILQLGRALIDEGFDVQYHSNTLSYRPEKERWTIHPSWARSAVVFKDGQRVGFFQVWTPEDRYSWSKPVGWAMETNRGRGNARAYSTTKRLKKLESAVTYFKETAVPKRMIEEELATAKKVRLCARNQVDAITQRINREMNGLGEKHSHFYSGSDGTLTKLIEAYERNDTTTINTILQGKSRDIGALRVDLREAEAMLASADKEVERLQKIAAEQVPEVYS